MNARTFAGAGQSGMIQSGCGVFTGYGVNRES